MTDESNAQKPNVSYSMGTGYSTGGHASAQGSMSGSAPDFGAANPPAQGASSGQVIKDITTQSFMIDVIEASNVGPVIVDFWAPWCGPCKQLGPTIEKVVTAAAGAVTLCKMDIEQYPEIAGQMGIQSIPAVVAFVNGRPAEAFMGAKPESEVQAFVDKLIANNPRKDAGAGPDMAALLDEGNALLQAGDFGGAADIFSNILAHEAGNLDALAGLGQCYLGVGEPEQAQALVNSVPEEHHNEGALAALVKALELAAQASDLGELPELARLVEEDPKNHQARMDYALALNAHGEREQAAEQLIAIVRADRKWNDDGARVKLLELFEVWGNADPATVSGRRMLSSVLFS